MNNRERNSLDRYITGSYGEDQFKDNCGGCELDCEICGVHQSDYESLRKHYDWHNDQNAKQEDDNG